MPPKVDRLRRLDALFSERVLGCHVVRNACACVDHKHTCDERMGDGYDLLPYTRSIDSAWEGAEVLCKRTEPPEVGLVGLRFSGQSDLAYHATVSGNPVGAAHPAEALVLACLRAVGCSEEELA